MLKIFLCAIAFYVPCIGYGGDLNNPRRLNLEVRSTNTCSAKQTLSYTRESLSISQSSYLYWKDICRYQPLPVWQQDNTVNNDVTTWLRLKSSQSHDIRMIGLGFRFQVADAGVAHIKVRGGGGIQFRYRTTF